MIYFSSKNTIIFTTFDPTYILLEVCVALLWICISFYGFWDGWRFVTVIFQTLTLRPILWLTVRLIRGPSYSIWEDTVVMSFQAWTCNKQQNNTQHNVDRQQTGGGGANVYTHTCFLYIVFWDCTLGKKSVLFIFTCLANWSKIILW